CTPSTPSHCLGPSRHSSTLRPTLAQIEAWRISHVNRSRTRNRKFPKFSKHPPIAISPLFPAFSVPDTFFSFFSPFSHEFTLPVRRSGKSGRGSKSGIVASLILLQAKELIAVAAIRYLPGTTPAVCRSHGRSARACWNGGREPCRSPAC